MKQRIGYIMRHNKQGFTLVELMIAMTMASILAGGLFSFFISMQRHYQKEQARIEEMQSLRLVGHIIDTQIRRSSQSLEMDKMGSCTILKDVDATASNRSELTNLYCLNDTDLTINGATHINHIQSFTIRAEYDAIDGLKPRRIKRLIFSIEGSLGGNYDKVFVLRQ